MKKITFLVVLFAIISFTGCKTNISEHNHTFDTNWTSDNTYHWHAATCEHSEEISDKAEHTWDKGTVTTEATFTETGVITYKCTVCEKTKTQIHPVKVQMTTSEFFTILGKEVEHITAIPTKTSGIIYNAETKTANIFGVILAGETSSTIKFPVSLKTADLTGLDTSNVTDSGDMFCDVASEKDSCIIKYTDGKWTLSTNPADWENNKLVFIPLNPQK